MQNICDGGAIKHGSDFSCVCDPGHTVQSNQLFAMRRNKRNGQPDEGVCDIEHTVHSDELFVIRQHKRNGHQIKVCVIEGIRFKRINSLRLGNRTETGQPD